MFSHRAAPSAQGKAFKGKNEFKAYKQIALAKLCEHKKTGYDSKIKTIRQENKNCKIKIL